VAKRRPTFEEAMDQRRGEVSGEKEAELWTLTVEVLMNAKVL
jgi:hypothetical protein